MSDVFRATIPVRVARPAHDRSGGRRARRSTGTTLELDIPQANLLAAIYPDEPTHLADATAAAADALEQPRLRAALLRADRGRQVRRDRDRQPVPARRRSRASCRPSSTRSRPPASTDAVVICANGKVFPMSESDTEQKIGRRTSRAWSGMGIPFFQNEPRNAETYTLHRRLLARHAGLAAQGGREARRQDHDRPGAVEPLGRGRRRQADPAGRRLRRDDRVEPLRLRAVAGDALRRVRAARCAPTSTRSRRCAASTRR